jgi:8-oxo-dGTP pyrophosphatase MutT (NUDIX family)
MKKEIKSWEILDTKLLQKTRVFDLLVQRLRSPESAYEDDFYYIRLANWTNIIPITKDREIVLVRQYRFGSHETSLELPGGVIDPGEDPKAAALRELKEETGYEADDAEQVGWVRPNPAIQTNFLYAFVAHNVRLADIQSLDPAESISVELYPLSDIPRLISTQEISHSMMVSTFMQFFAHYPDYFINMFR